MQRKQFLVTLPNKDKGDKFIEYLESKGFLNIHKISFDELKIKVLVVDVKEFFPVNVTCLSALASCGIKPIGVEDFITIYDNAN